LPLSFFPLGFLSFFFTHPFLLPFVFLFSLIYSLLYMYTLWYKDNMILALIFYKSNLLS
jgi:hypothetical protein